MTLITKVTDDVDDVRASQYNALVDALQSITPGGRLTLTSGTPVTTSDVTGATTVYYTPYVHNIINLWDGSIWQPVAFTEKSLALGTITSGLPYDVFGYLSAGALVLEKLAWTNTTTRATGISLQDGRYCKTGDKTRLYLGTFYTTSTTQTEDSDTKRFLFNMYNRAGKRLLKTDTTSHTYSTGSFRQWNNDANNQVAFVNGVQDEAYTVSTRQQTSGAINGQSGIAVDGTGSAVPSLFSQVASMNQFATAFNGPPAVGYHYIAITEYGAASVTFAVGNVLGTWRC